MTKFILEEFAKELKSMKVVGISRWSVMATVQQGFPAVTEAFTTVMTVDRLLF